MFALGARVPILPLVIMLIIGARREQTTSMLIGEATHIGACGRSKHYSFHFAFLSSFCTIGLIYFKLLLRKVFEAHESISDDWLYVR